MTSKELDRHLLLRQVLSKQLTQVRAAELLGLTTRQVRNLLKAFKFQGVKGIVSKKRGRPSNRTTNPKIKQQIMGLVRERYPDFGPTFAAEKLAEHHNLPVSVETLRKWLIKENLWIAKQKRKNIHPLRARRECFGELIQIDASIHAWFEDRANKCALIVFIDDATSKITSAFFCSTECLEGYFTALKAHLMKYGRPRGLYSDRHAIFGGAERIKQAQFTRALKELEIELVLANSPQAKGRVERANKTLQDRLIKEMRLRGISDVKSANLYLQEFIEKYNKKFSKEPKGECDTHRPIESGCDLERILSRSETRTVSKDLSFSFYNKYYQILEPLKINRLRYKKIEVRQRYDGAMRVFYQGKELKFTSMKEWQEKQVLDSKTKLIWKPSIERHPNKSHPWLKYSYQWALSKRIKEGMV